MLNAYTMPGKCTKRLTYFYVYVLIRVQHPVLVSAFGGKGESKAELQKVQEKYIQRLREMPSSTALLWPFFLILKCGVTLWSTSTSSWPNCYIFSLFKKLRKPRKSNGLRAWSQTKNVKHILKKFVSFTTICCQENLFFSSEAETSHFLELCLPTEFSYLRQEQDCWKASHHYPVGYHCPRTLQLLL